MAKYSDAFKLQVVQEYLDGPLGYKALAKKYAIPDAAPVRQWVRAFQAFGVEGLKRKRKKTVYPVQFKVDALHFMKETGASYAGTAIAFGMNNPSLIANWNQNKRSDLPCPENRISSRENKPNPLLFPEKSWSVKMNY